MNCGCEFNKPIPYVYTYFQLISVSPIHITPHTTFIQFTISLVHPQTYTFDNFLQSIYLCAIVYGHFKLSNKPIQPHFSVYIYNISTLITLMNMFQSTSSCVFFVFVDFTNLLSKQEHFFFFRFDFISHINTSCLWFKEASLLTIWFANVIE